MGRKRRPVFSAGSTRRIAENNKAFAGAVERLDGEGHGLQAHRRTMLLHAWSEVG
jgi:hypothetical protein